MSRIYKNEQRFQKIERNADNIKKASDTFNIPQEVIGSIILKEQYTQTLPDEVAMATAASVMGEGYPGLSDSKIFGLHSTGLGAIFPDTAREAWNRYTGGRADRILPASDVELQRKLMEDDEFNIRTIAVVLGSKALDLGLIDNYSQLSTLSRNEWQKVLSAYNGSSEYGRKTIQYWDDMSAYLKSL